MKEFLNLYNEQLSNARESLYKQQLEKYGESVARKLVEDSIVGLVCRVRAGANNSKASKFEIKLASDLESYRELIQKKEARLNKIEEATSLAIRDINNIIMNTLLNNNSIEVEFDKKHVLAKKDFKRLLIVGNEMLPKNYHIQPTVDNTDLKFIGHTGGGDILYHSCRIPSREIYAIRLDENRLFNYFVECPLALINSKFVHSAKIELVTPELLQKIIIK